MPELPDPSRQAPPCVSSPDLRDVLNLLPVPVAILTPEGRVRFINRTPLADLGLAAEDVTGKFFWETPWVSYSEKSRAEVRAAVARAAAGDTVQCELIARFSHQDDRIFACSFRRLHDTSGGAAGIIACGVDITGLKGHEQKLHHSQLLLEGIVEHLPMMLFLKRASDLQFQLFNRAAEEVLGYSREQLLGKCDHDFWPKAQADAFTAADREVLASDQVKKIDLEPIRSANRETRYLRTWKVALRDRAGRPEYLLGISDDITDEIATLEELRLSEEKLRGLYEMAPIGIALTDSSGRYVEYNEAFRRICGYPDDELKTLDYWKLTPPEYFKMEQMQLRSLQTSGRYGPYEKEYVQKDGTRIPIRLSGISVQGTDGQTYTWSIVEDIAEQKATEETLRQAHKMKAVGQLTAGVAHDFNNLLAVISGNLELLLDDPSVSPRVQTLAALALKTARRGGELTQHLLAYGRKQQLNAGVHDLGRRIESTARWLKRTLPANIRVVARGTDTPLLALVDEAQLENCLLNLSLNARDAMPAGGTLTFTLAAVETDSEVPVYSDRLSPGRYARITVADTGYGMTPQILSEAFDPFFTTKPMGQGNGLGLSMVYGFVRQSGGRIAVASEVGRGTSFDIYFPLSAADTAAAAADTAPAAPPPAPDALRLLLVEDIPEVRETVGLQLESFGHTVSAVANAEDALDLLLRRDFDLLITDLGLPGSISGQDLCERALALKPGLGLLTMSGYNESLTEARQPPSAAHLRKPFETAELKRAVAAVMARRPAS